MRPQRCWFNHVLEAPLIPEARAAIERLLAESSVAGAPPDEAARAGIVESARTAVARLLGVPPEEILLTSGGTEAANLAIKGIAGAHRGPARRLVTTAVEALAVLHPIRTLGRAGFEPVLLPVDSAGRVDADRAGTELRRGAALLSVQHGNHEVGTIQPIEDLGRAAHAQSIPFHVDAVATAGLLPLRPREIGIDLLSLSASRLGGAAGAGALWVRDGVRLQPQIEGGTQEGGLRAGGENLLGLAALAAAADVAAGNEEGRGRHARRLRDRLFRLRRAGIEASSGSPCVREAGKPSHVLEAMGVEPRLAQSSVLFSLGPGSRDEEVDRALEAVPDAVEALRAIAAP